MRDIERRLRVVEARAEARDRGPALVRVVAPTVAADPAALAAWQAAQRPRRGELLVVNTGVPPREG